MIEALKVVAPLTGWSGYDIHSRAFIREFVTLGVRVQWIPAGSWSPSLPPDQRDAAFFDPLIAPVESRTVLHFTIPTQTRPDPIRRNVNFTMFEANRIPPLWAQAAQSQALIIVPTAASQAAWIAGGIAPEKLRIAPLGVDGAFFSQPSDPLAVVSSTGQPLRDYHTRFLHVAELRPRKNHVGLLRSWMKATTPRDSAVLIMKVTAFHPHALAQLQADIAALEHGSGMKLANAAPIIVLSSVLTRVQLRALYHTATHCISVSYGEGWDMVMMEAAAAGLRLIVPAHSAYIHYLKPDDADFIPADLVPAVITGHIGAEDRLLFEGLSWWQPDENAAAAIIRRIIDQPEDHRVHPQARILREYTWKNAAQALLDALG